MAKVENIVAILIVIVAWAGMLQNIDAAVYDVGDALGWTVPPGGDSVYTRWASKHTFRENDSLVFQFVTGIHDVAEVSESDYHSCNSSDTEVLKTIGPANFTLNHTGDYYFICTFPNHCSRGQKLTVKVSRSSSHAPHHAPSPHAESPSISKAPGPHGSTAATAPQGSSATSHVAVFSLAVITFSVNALFLF